MTRTFSSLRELGMFLEYLAEEELYRRGFIR